jgi:hypothetical protein
MFFVRALFVPARALWGAHDIEKMADLGILKGLTLMVIKHPNALDMVAGPLKELNDQAKRLNSPIVIFDGSVLDIFKQFL